MKNKLVALISLVIVCSSFATSTGNISTPENHTLRVILIRHAEKSPDGSNLDCAGLNRSLKLPAVIKAKYGIPDYIYVPSVAPSEQTKYLRMMQTVTPLAIKYNLDINSSFGVDDTERLAKQIRGDNGTVLVVWEHKRLVDIAEMLGVKSGYLNWDKAEYDKIWVVTITNGQAELTIDKEDIQPGSGCGF